MNRLCGKCGDPLTGATERVIPIPGRDPMRVCEKCEPQVTEAAKRMAEAMALRPRELHVARADTLYKALMETCLPIAARIYLSSCERDGIMVTANDLGAYQMGFVDAVWCIAQGELRLATMEKSPEPVIQETKP